jgi:hypothetical protein
MTTIRDRLLDALLREKGDRLRLALADSLIRDSLLALPRPLYELALDLFRLVKRREPPKAWQG